jgi:integrase
VKGTYVHRVDLTVEQACENWLVSRRLADTSMSGYAWILRPARSELGHLQVQRLTRRDVDELVQALRAGGTTSETTRTLRDGTTKTTLRKRKPWSARSCNYMLQTFGMVLNELKNDGAVAVNVVERVDRVPGDAEKFTTYTAEQVTQLLNSIAQDRNRHIWYLALSALRRGEIGGLDWTKDVDLVSEKIRVGRRTRVSAGGRVVEKMSGKTVNAGRELPLWEPLLGELRAAKAGRPPRSCCWVRATKTAGMWCATRRASPITRTHCRTWAAVTKAAGVPHIRLQDARHTAATLMLMNGVDPATVSGWLGHANVGFTMKTYVHAQPEAMAKGKARSAPSGGPQLAQIRDCRREFRASCDNP